MSAQRRAVVAGAKQPAPLKLRHGIVDERGELIEEISRHDVEPVAAAGFHSMPHVINLLFDCADECAVRARFGDEIAAGTNAQTFTVGAIQQIDHARREALARRGDADTRQSRVESVVIKPQSQLLAEHPDADGGQNQLVQLGRSEYDG